MPTDYLAIAPEEQAQFATHPGADVVADGWLSARSWQRQLSWFLCATTLVLLLATLALAIVNRGAPDAWAIADPTQAVGAVAYSLFGALLTLRRPGNLIGWLFLVNGLIVQAGSLSAHWAVFALETRPTAPGGAHALWLSLALGSAALGVFPLLLFPTGQLHDRRTRLLTAATSIVGIALVLFLISGNTYPPGFPQIFERTPNPLALSRPLGDPALAIIALGICLLLSALLLLARFRAAHGIERQQYKWVMLDMAFIAAAFVADFVARASGSHAYVVTNPILSLLIALVPVAMGIAILRNRLWDIDLVINRTLVYLSLSACVVGIYVFVVGWLGTLFRTGNNLLFSLAATGVVAIFFQPLRERIQRQVNRVFYGERDEPYAVISRLGRRLEATFTLETALPAIADTIREALKLPYAAIELDDERGGRRTAASGELVADPLRLPLLYRRAPVGELLLAPRGPGETFGSADRQLLDDLARQVAVAVHAVRLTRELQRARERLVETREEERRRLRRDLHDGLGSQLVALNLQWGALGPLIANDPHAAQAEVGELRGQLRAAIATVRTLVHDLRPPAIDELGLLVALRARARQYGASGLAIATELPEQLPALPAAVEVALYRIVEEALANVAKHARARWCRVQLTLDGGLILRVEDDGIGIAPTSRAGVGLRSMRERAEELGGSFRIEPRPSGGTRLTVTLPLGERMGEETGDER